MGYRPRPTRRNKLEKFVECNELELATKPKREFMLSARARQNGYFVVSLLITLGLMLQLVFGVVSPMLVAGWAAVVGYMLTHTPNRAVNPKDSKELNTSFVPEYETKEVGWDYVEPANWLEAIVRTAASEHELGWVPHSSKTIQDRCRSGCNNHRMLGENGVYVDYNRPAMPFDKKKSRPPDVIQTEGIGFDSTGKKYRIRHRQNCMCGTCVGNQIKHGFENVKKAHANRLESTKVNEPENYITTQWNMYLNGSKSLLDAGVVTPNEVRSHWEEFKDRELETVIIRAADGTVVRTVTSNGSDDALYKLALEELRAYAKRDVDKSHIPEYQPLKLPTGITASFVKPDDVPREDFLADLKAKVEESKRELEAIKVENEQLGHSQKYLEKRSEYWGAIFKSLSAKEELWEAEKTASQADLGGQTGDWTILLHGQRRSVADLRKDYFEWKAGRGKNLSPDDIMDKEVQMLARFFEAGG